MRKHEVAHQSPSMMTSTSPMATNRPPVARIVFASTSEPTPGASCASRASRSRSDSRAFARGRFTSVTKVASPSLTLNRLDRHPEPERGGHPSDGLVARVRILRSNATGKRGEIMVLRTEDSRSTRSDSSRDHPGDFVASRTRSR
jgi:hypothetical protein